MDDAPCTCLICQDASPGREASTVWHVKEYGWSALLVSGGRVDFAYTIGLWHTFRRPEVAMFGLGGQGMQIWLNACVDQCRVNGWPADGEEFQGVIEGFPTQLRPVHPSWHDGLFGTAWRFYQGTAVPFLQLVWPDAAGVWPWYEQATLSSRTNQPFAWLPAQEHPRGGWRLVAEMAYGFPFHGGPDQYALTNRALMDGRTAVTRIVNHDGGFDVLDSRGYDADGLCLAFLGDIARRHPDIRQFADLADEHTATLKHDDTWITTSLTGPDRDASERAREQARSAA